MKAKLNGLAPANALSRNTKTESKEVMKNFNPLDSYGDWVSVPYLTMQNDPRSTIRHEVQAVLHEQISTVIPNYWVYRRQVQFKETQQMDTLEWQVTWLYTPNLRIIEAELERSVQKLNQVRDPIFCKVISLATTEWYSIVRNVGSPAEKRMSRIFTTRARAQDWIRRYGGIEC